MKKRIFILLIATILIVAMFIIFPISKSNKINAIIYKSSSCGCCGNYIPYLEGKGFDLKINVMENVNPIKEQYGIPNDMRSCHTIILGNYFIEGHVPIEAINKLLSEQPDIDGITLPNMPAGSPGMPGTKAGDFIIYSIKDNNVIGEFMRI